MSAIVLALRCTISNAACLRASIDCACAPLTASAAARAARASFILILRYVFLGPKRARILVAAAQLDDVAVRIAAEDRDPAVVAELHRPLCHLDVVRGKGRQRIPDRGH